MLSNMPPMTWAMTIWLDQFLIGILIGLLLSAALAATETLVRVAQASAATRFLNELDFTAFMVPFLSYLFGSANGAPNYC